MTPEARLALIGFLFHGPGVRVLGGRSMDARTWRLNLGALACTGAAMVAGLVASGPWGLFWAWFIGHMAWGSLLARALLRGGAVVPEPRRG
jgi:hypothetical protein